MMTSVPPIVPCVMNCLLPFRTQCRPSWRAEARIATASLPAPASVRPQAPQHLALGQRHQVLPLLRLAAEHEEVRRREPVVRGHRQRNRRIDARQLFDADAVLDRRHAGAAVGLRHLNAGQSEGRELGQEAPAGTPALRPTPSRAGESRLRQIRGPSGAGAPARRSWRRSIA